MTKEILEFLQSGSVGWAFVVLLLLWATKLDIPKIFDQRRSFRDKDIESLEQALASDHFDEAFKSVMKKRLTELVFERHVGIFADEEKRNALIIIHNANPKKATWTVLRRANPYIQVREDGCAEVIMKRGHKIERIITQGCTLLIGAYAGFLFLLGLVTYWIEGQGVIQFGALALAVFALAVFFSTMDWPYQAAVTVKEVLAEKKRVCGSVGSKKTSAPEELDILDEA